MRAQDIMITNPQVIVSTTTIWTALALMRDQDIRHLVVTDAQGTLVGVLSNRDFRRALNFLDPTGTIRHVNNLTVAEIMTKTPEVITAHPDTPLLNLAQLIVVKKVGCVPVLDAQRRVVGIVTQKDVMGALVRQLAPPSMTEGT